MCCYSVCVYDVWVFEHKPAHITGYEWRSNDDFWQ